MVDWKSGISVALLEASQRYWAWLSDTLARTVISADTDLSAALITELICNGKRWIDNSGYIFFPFDGSKAAEHSWRMHFNFADKTSSNLGESEQRAASKHGTQMSPRGAETLEV